MKHGAWSIGVDVADKQVFACMIDGALVQPVFEIPASELSVETCMEESAKGGKQLSLSVFRPYFY